MNVGDFGYFDFNLVEVKRIENGILKEVSDGMFSTYGNLSDGYFPVSLRIKNISEIFMKLSNKIHENHFPSLNYPDIHRYLVSQWIDACNTNNEKANDIIKETESFVDDTLEYCEGTKQHTINGVRIVGR
jgi:hypothetical protein